MELCESAQQITNIAVCEDLKDALLIYDESKQKFRIIGQSNDFFVLLNDLKRMNEKMDTMIQQIEANEEEEVSVCTY